MIGGKKFLYIRNVLFIGFFCKTFGELIFFYRLSESNIVLKFGFVVVVVLVVVVVVLLLVFLLFFRFCLYSTDDDYNWTLEHFKSHYV